MIPLDDAPAAGGRRAAVREREEAVVASLRSLGVALDGEPDPAFRAATRARLVAMAAVRTPAAVPEPRSPIARLLHREPTRSPVRRRLTAGLAGAALAVTAAAGLVAVASDATPGDPLYALKRGTEQTQLALSGSERGLTLLGFARTRLSELSALTRSGNTGLAVETLRSMDDETTQGAAALTAGAVAGHDPAAARRLATWGARQSAGLAAVRAHLPAGATPAVDRSAALITRVTDRGTSLTAALQCTTGPAVGGTDPLGPVPLPCPTAASSAPAQVGGGSTGSAPVPGTGTPAEPNPATGETGGAPGATTGGTTGGATGSSPGGATGTGEGTPGAGTGGSTKSSSPLPSTGLPATGGSPLPPVGTSPPSTSTTLPRVTVGVPPLPGTTAPRNGSDPSTPSASTGPSLPSVSNGPSLPSVSACLPPVGVGTC